MRHAAFILAGAMLLGGCGWLGLGRQRTIKPEQNPGPSPEAARPAEPESPGEPGAPATRPADIAPPPTETRPSDEASSRPGSPGGEGAPTVVAAAVLQVNDRFITLGEILRPLRRSLQSAAGGASREDFRRKALELIRAEVRNQVERTVLLAQASKGQTDEEKAAIDEEVARRLREMTARAGSRTALAQHLRDEGTDLAAWTEEMRQALAVSLYLHRRFGQRIQVTHRMMWDHYRAHAAEFRSPDGVQMQIIAAPLRKFLPDSAEPTDAQRQAARRQASQRIEQAAAELGKGEDFAQVARRLSLDPMASEGGVWPMMERGSFLAGEVEKAAFDQPIGSVSKVIETPQGFYVVKTLDRREGKDLSFQDAQPRIEQALREQQYQRLREEYLRELQAKTTVRVSEQFERLAVEAAERMFFPAR